MIKLMLNLHKFNNYAFFCPVSRLHLTVSSPIGFSNEVTPAILKALKSETILDVDGVINIEAGTVNAGKQETPKPVQEKKAPEQPKSSEPEKENNGDTRESDSNKDVAPEVKPEPKVEPKIEEKSKRGKKAAASTETEEAK